MNTKLLFQEIQELTNSRFTDIQLILDIQEQTVLGDKELLITCIMNLIENAYKASDNNKKIDVIGKIFLNKYRIIIIDYGIGIDKSEIERITEDFYMVDRSRNKKKNGYGLGLGLCSKILKIHNSKLDFKSKLGEGTEVSFDLEVIKYEK